MAPYYRKLIARYKVKDEWNVLVITGKFKFSLQGKTA
jgi:hypothetical protein